MKLNAAIFIGLFALLTACSPNNVKSDAAIGKILDSAGLYGSFAILDNGTEQFEIKDTSHKNDVIADFKEKILSLIDEKEKIIFEKKFEFIIPKLFIKPLKSPLEDYLTSIGLVVDDFYPKFKTIKNVRDSITHGSISTHSLDKLESVNAMLYRISICIILDYLKIENWKEIVDITNEKKR